MYDIKELPNRIDIYLTKGDTFVAKVDAIRRSTGEVYEPVQGDTIRFALKRCITDETSLIYKPIPYDTMILRIESADTKDLPLGIYTYDIQITFENGDVDTFISGYFNLTKEVE